ncbi:MAG: O-unit flippase-like protein [Daejeonella sp.]
MKISKIDVLWNFGATFLRVATGIILLPLALRMLSAEDVGLWTVFITVGSFTLLIDFGFSAAFTRNVIYIFSGAKDLKPKGYELVSDSQIIDYSLLKGIMIVMRRYYLIVALALLFVMLTAGSFYISSILKSYTGNYNVAISSWILYILLTVYQMYTLYYDALMQGRGLISRLKQIIIISQILEITITAIFLVAGFGIFSMVVGKFISVLTNRFLCYRSFFDAELTAILKSEIPYSPKKLFKIVSPNAVKIGITSLGGFLIQRSSFFIGSLYLTLSDVASYGITLQVLNLLAAVSNIYIATYLPKITFDRVNNNSQSIKRVYLNGLVAIAAFYIIGAAFLIFLGNPALEIIDSKTFFVARPVMILALVLSIVETNFVMAGNILHTKNEVPFFKASIVSGIAIFILMLLSFEFTSLGLYGMVIVPLIVDLAYQGWKWPLEMIREFNINASDFRDIIQSLLSGKRIKL